MNLNNSKSNTSSTATEILTPHITPRNRMNNTLVATSLPLGISPLRRSNAFRLPSPASASSATNQKTNQGGRRKRKTHRRNKRKSYCRNKSNRR